MSALYLFTYVAVAVCCIFFIGAAATAGVVAASSQVASVYVSYYLTPSCRTFLQQQQQNSLQQHVFRQNPTKVSPLLLKNLPADPTVEISVPTAALRQAMLQVLEEEVSLRGNHATPSLSKQSESIFGLYDITQFTFHERSLRGIHQPDEKHEITFQWFKHVEVDRVTVPLTSAISISKWLAYLRSLPCVAFALPNEQRPIEEQANFTPPTLPPLGDTSNDIFAPAEEMPDKATVTAEEGPIPNDPYYEHQKWYLNMMNVSAAWEIWRGPIASEDQAKALFPSFPSSDGIIAVTDTGCDITHPDIRQRLWRNPGEICDNGLDDDGNGYVDDCYGWNFVDRNADLAESFPHGTSVFGASGSATHNRVGTAGVCWTCELMCLRIGHSSLDLGAFVEAVNYALLYGAKIINFSAGGGDSVMERWAIQAAMAHDVVIVVAAGNEACDLDGNERCTATGFPARYSFPNMLVVGALNSLKKRAFFSNFGETSVDVFAPGEDILLPRPMHDSMRPMFGRASGTSFSAPLVTGVVALLRSRYPRLSYHSIIQAIRGTCRPLPDLTGTQTVNGRISSSKRAAVCPGVVDARAALMYAEKLMAQIAED